MSFPDPLNGKLFDGRYKIIKKIGAGGMADVYCAEDQELGRQVAIKILNDRHAGDEQFVERFRREAQNAAGLNHPNIVSIYDRGEAEGTYYIAMEFLDGRSLKELIVARGPSPIPVAIGYARQVLAALRFSHRNGIVLRALAKDPHDRYASAEEMDADLARIAKGLAISDETHEAATQVLSGAGLMSAAPTTISRAPTLVTRPGAAPPPVAPLSFDF